MEEFHPAKLNKIELYFYLDYFIILFKKTIGFEVRVQRRIHKMKIHLYRRENEWIAMHYNKVQFELRNYPQSFTSSVSTVPQPLLQMLTEFQGPISSMEKLFHRRLREETACMA